MHDTARDGTLPNARRPRPLVSSDDEQVCLFLLGEQRQLLIEAPPTSANRERHLSFARYGPGPGAQVAIEQGVQLRTQSFQLDGALESEARVLTHRPGYLHDVHVAGTNLTQ